MPNPFIPQCDISGKAVYVLDNPPVKKDPNSARYSKIASLSGRNSMNIFEVVSSLSKPEQKFLVELSHKFNWNTYLLSMDLSSLTKTERSNKYRAFGKLHKKDLVKRVSTHVYLINPRLLIPSIPENEKHAKKLWDILP